MNVVAALLMPFLCVGALPLPRCTIGVVGANGRVGSYVCRELLRKHPEVTVRALVRSSTDTQGYGLLSYIIGAEDARMDITPAWTASENGPIGGKRTTEFDQEVQGGYGLDRLEVRECEVRFKSDVENALGDVDAVVYCASTFDRSRRRDPLGEIRKKINKIGMNVFELRFGGKEKDDEAERQAAAEGKTADVEGLQNVVAIIEKKRRRDESLAKLGDVLSSSKRMNGLPAIVALSAASQLAIDGWGNENPFGYSKRLGEIAIKESDLDAVVVRSAAIDEWQTRFGLEVKSLSAKVPDEASTQLVGISVDEEAKKRRIHQQDLARYLVECLSGDALKSEGATNEDDVSTSERVFSTVEVWT